MIWLLTRVIVVYFIIRVMFNIFTQTVIWRCTIQITWKQINLKITKLHYSNYDLQYLVMCQKCVLNKISHSYVDKIFFSTFGNIIYKLTYFSEKVLLNQYKERLNFDLLLELFSRPFYNYWNLLKQAVKKINFDICR